MVFGSPLKTNSPRVHVQLVKSVYRILYLAVPEDIYEDSPGLTPFLLWHIPA